MNIYLLIYFFVGVLQDILFTLNIRLISLKKIWWAVLCSFALTLLSTLVIYDIVSRVKNVSAIVAYSLGVASGTFLAMKLRLEPKK